MHVRFRVGEERFALPVASVNEVAEVGELSSVPGAPAAVLGVRNLRGQVLPVVDLAAVLDIDRSSDALRLLIVERGGHRTGLVVSEVSDVSQLIGEPDEIRILDLDAVFARLEPGVTP